MGLINTLEYYSGMIFQVYLKKTGVIVGSGGRYDKLMKKFGRDIPAVGFGLNVNTLMDCLLYTSNFESCAETGPQSIFSRRRAEPHPHPSAERAVRSYL